MMYVRKFLVLVWSIVWFSSLAQQQEVVIIGTMHGVYGLSKRAYKPMLKKAIKYQPQSVFAESRPAWDTVSVKNYNPTFFHRSDSLRKVMTFDTDEINSIKAKALKDLKEKEARLLHKFYYANLDLANVGYYRRIAKYGFGPLDKPQGYETGDLTQPLAIEMGIKEIKSMDNQTFYNEYGRNWYQCDSLGKFNGNEKAIQKLLRQTWWSEATALLTGLGKATNRPKIYEPYHTINSMEYRVVDTPECVEANGYWDYRNTQMVKNTAEQILESGHIRNVVVVGSGHTYGMMEAFARDYPQIKVIPYKDMPNNIGKANLKK